MSTARLLVEISLSRRSIQPLPQPLSSISDATGGLVRKLSFMPRPLSVCSVDPSVVGDASAKRSLAKDNKLISEIESTVEGIVLGVGGCELVKDSSR